MMLYHGFIAVPLLAAFVPHEAWTAIDPRVVIEIAIENAVGQLEIFLLAEQLDTLVRQIRSQ